MEARNKTMKKIITRSVITIVLILGAVIWILFLNSHFGFLPEEVTATVDDFCYKIFNKEDDIGNIDTSDYVLLSSLSDSSLLENMDLSVPKDTYIPSQEEIEKVYKGLYSDSIIASCSNYDIIIQNYGIETSGDFELEDFRTQVASAFQKSYPSTNFDVSHSVFTNGIEVPIIEFSMENDERVTYSYIAFVEINNKLITIAVNSVDTLFDSNRFFNTLLKNMIIK